MLGRGQGAFRAMSVQEEQLKNQLEILRRGFVSRLPDRVLALDEQFSVWRQGGGEDALEDFHRGAHSLTGAAATYGCMVVSAAARLLEQRLKSLKDESFSMADVVPELVQLLDDVREGLNAPDAQVEASVEDASAKKKTFELKAVPPRARKRDLFLLERSLNAEKTLVEDLQHFGYHVTTFVDTEQLLARLESDPPAVVVADVEVWRELDVEVDLSKEGDGEDETVPLIFICNSPSFETRLDAVRMRGRFLFVKPFGVESLVDALDSITDYEEEKRYRVVVIDDYQPQAEHSATVLHQAGMEVRVVIDPRTALAVIDEFRPELILMDVYMPHCSGMELAAVIRQQPEYVGIPIVFLSSETDRSVQLVALRQGGDDFLTKPINPGNLIDSVAIRAGRYRVLRTLMVRDSLTGLFNHSKILDSLVVEGARASRNGSEFCFAMIDIDHFKKVNDSYGHGVGDVVIKSLARLLQQRLRKSDVIGRYGGEEFAVVMPDTSMENCVRVMNEIRNSFSQLTHHTGEQSFQVTLSCGIAKMAPGVEPGDIRELADERLYIAKHNGRNLVVGEADAH